MSSLEMLGLLGTAALASHRKTKELPLKSTGSDCRVENSKPGTRGGLSGDELWLHCTLL